MASNSLMKCTGFTSDFTLAQLNDLYEEYLGTMPGGGEDVLCWQFEQRGEQYQPENEGAWGRGRGHDELAKFISMVCKEEVSMDIMPELGGPWSYTIKPGLVYVYNTNEPEVLYNGSDEEAEQLIAKAKGEIHGEA